jgi:pilus assembly protein CpaB
MNRRVSMVLFIALIVSGSATYLIYRMISTGGAGKAPATITVVTAARPLEIGTLLKATDLKSGAWVGAPPTGMVTKPESIIGRGVISPIFEGEAIMENRLAAPGAGGGLAATIPSGKRAVAVRVNDIVGVAGFVVPGMRVDILIAGTPPGAQANHTQVKTLLQNIEVLSAGQNFQKDAEGKPIVVPVVNLLVTPEQAEVLSLASNETRIQLVLRNPLDTEASKTPGVALGGLFGEKPPAPAAAPAAPRWRPVVVKQVEPPPVPRIVPLPPYHVEVINGAAKADIQFSRPATEEKK